MDVQHFPEPYFLRPLWGVRDFRRLGLRVSLCLFQGAALGLDWCFIPTS